MSLELLRAGARRRQCSGRLRMGHGSRLLRPSCMDGCGPLAAVLTGWGVGKGDRVILLCENRWEWPVTGLRRAGAGCGGCAALCDAGRRSRLDTWCGIRGRRVAFVSSKEQFDKLRGAGEMPELQHVVVMDEISSDAPYESFSGADGAGWGDAGTGCGVRRVGEVGPAGRLVDDHLHLGDDGRAEGGAAGRMEILRAT